MATFKDLKFDWSMLCQECTECWTQQDLQLAAELGKTLLERNKELETSLKQHQNIIEDQTQEIEYLTKQTIALREVNDSRLRIYEQLEVSIHDLERANHRLTLDAAADKKQIKSLCANVNALEVRSEELQTTVDQLTSQLDTYKRKCERIEASEHGETVRSHRNKRVTIAKADEGSEFSHDKQVQCDSTTKPEIRSCNVETSTSPILFAKNISTSKSMSGTDVCDGSAENEQMLAQLCDLRMQRARDHRRVVELEEQLAALVQENQGLETQLLNASTRDEAMKSMHDELNTLDEVRQGQLCPRCLRNAEDRMTNDDMSILDTEEEDDDNISMMDAIINETRYRSSVSLNIQQGYCELTSVLRRLLSMFWKLSTPTLYTIFLEFFFLLRDYVLIPFFYSPRRLPLLLLCFIMTHDKLQTQY